VKNVSKKMISLGIKEHSLQPLLKMSNIGEGNTKRPRPGKVIEFINITMFVIICLGQDRLFKQVTFVDLIYLWNIF